MKKIISILSLLVIIAVFAAPTAAQSAPTITFVNPPPDGVLVLGVSESYTFEVQVSSDVPFLLSQLAFDQYYPGRSVFADGVQSAHNATSATMQLTVTGKMATSRLPGGVAPVAVVVALRYPGGVVVAEQFPFMIVVQ